MSLWSNLFTPASARNADWHVMQGVRILDRSIQCGPRLVKCDLKRGQKARDHFRKALELHPGDPHVQMLYAVAHFYCAEPKQAKAELERARLKHPTDFEIRGLVEYDPWWRDVFHVPPWSPASVRLPPILNESIQGKVVLPVREGSRRVHSFFFRRQRVADFPDNVPRHVPCRVYPHIIRSPCLSGLAVVGCVQDNPANALKAEAFIFPGSGDQGKEAVIQLLQLARQTHAYVVVVDAAGRVMFNARVALDDHATKTLAQAAELAPSLKGQTLTLETIQSSVRWYQSQFSLDQIVF